KQKTAYEIFTCLEFRRVLFRSPKFKVYKTIWRDTIQMTVAKIQDMSLIALSTDQPKLARRWRRQITRIANLTEAIDTLGVNSQRSEERRVGKRVDVEGGRVIKE